MTDIKKILLSFLALLLILYPTVTSLGFGSSSYAQEVEDITINVDLVDGLVTKTDKITFDLWARTLDDVKIDTNNVQVTNNGEVVDINWNDEIKTSYTLNLVVGTNNVHIVVNHEGREYTRSFTIIREEAQNGDVIGSFTFSMDAFVVGLGYLIEPIKVDVIKGDNAAYHLDRVLQDYGFEYGNTGKLESGFYLSSISGEVLSERPPNPPSVILDKLNERGEVIPDIGNYDPESYGLGEFDFNHMSGWMYSVNNVFPNVGFDSKYLLDGDIMRVQFTVAYGSDIGGGYAMGGGDDSQFFPLVNKDYLTEAIAEINSSPARAELLSNDSLAAAYENGLAVLSTVDADQVMIDDALAQINYIRNAIDIEQQIDNLPEVDFISLNDEITLQTVRAAYEALNEQARNYVFNIAKLESLEQQLQILKDNEAASPEQEQADQVSVQIDALPALNDVQLSDEEAIATVRAAYEALNEQARNYVFNIAKLESLELQLQILKDNESVSHKQEQADQVSAQIDALPALENLQFSDEGAIQLVVNAYNLLSKDAQKLVTNIETLYKGEARMVDLKIKNLPLTDALTNEDKSNATKVRGYYNGLLEKSKELVTQLSKLQEIEELISKQNLEASNQVAEIDALIQALPAIEDVQLNDSAKVNIVVGKYELLSENTQLLVKEANKLLTIKKKLMQLQLETGEAVTQQIASLPDENSLKVTDEEKLKVVRTTYDALPVDAQKYVDNLSLSKLEALEAKLLTLKNTDGKELIQAVIEKITALPAITAVKESDETAIKEARTAYDKLTVEQRKNVTNYSKLQQLEQKLKDLNTNLPKAQAVIAQINQLPSVATVALTDKSKIVAARTAYNGLTAAQKALVTNLTTLTKLEQQITTLEKDSTKVQTAITQIGKLPNVSTVALKDKATIEAARKAYNALTIEQRKLVTNYQTLQNLEVKLAQLSETDTDDLKGTVNTKDAQFIMQSNSKVVSISSDMIQQQLNNKAIDTLVLKDDNGISIEIPKNALLNSIADKSSIIISKQIINGNNQNKFELKLEEQVSKNFKRLIELPMTYIKVTLPLSKLTNKNMAGASTQAIAKYNDKGVILKVENGEYSAVPHKIENGEVTIFANSSAQYEYTTDTVTFDDLGSVWNADEIEFLASRYVIKGTTPNTFSPQAYITRGQFAAMIARSLNLIATEETKIRDIKGHQFENEIQALYEAGITKASSQFEPNKYLNRQQAAAFMLRMMEYVGTNLEDVNSKLNFKDSDLIKGEFREAVGVLNSLEIMQGKPDQSFDPNGNLTRAQMAKILKRTLNEAGFM